MARFFYWYIFAVAAFVSVLLYLIKRKRRLSELAKMAGVVLLLTACFALALNIRDNLLDLRESRMPYRQPDTYWASDDGSITIDVATDSAGGHSDIFNYSMQAVIDGETYSAKLDTSYWQDGLPMAIRLHIRGHKYEYLSFSYSMPSDSELVLKPYLFRSRDGQKEDLMKALMSGRSRITVQRQTG